MTHPFESLSSQWLRRASARAAVDATGPSRANDEDIALGCECADPALQIERWPNDTAAERPRAT